jgi:hypothetical protein
MANPIALPGTNVPSGAAVSPGGAQGPSAVSANANNKAVLGSDSLVLVQGTAAGIAATTHAQTVSGDDPQLTNARTPTAHQASHVTGSDQIPLASASTKGLLNQTSGNTTDFIDGTNTSQPLQPTITAVRLRSFNSLGNPTFEVDQRNVGNVVANPASGTVVIDRWRVGKAGTMVISTQQAISGTSDVVPGTNFRISGNYFRLGLTTQETTLGAGDQFNVIQSIEGPRLRELIGDVHSLQLLVASTVAGLSFGVTLRDVPTTKTLTKLCTIPSANTNTLITLPNLATFASGGNWAITPGTVGYELVICLAAGSSATTPANDVWQNGSAFVGAVGQSNFAAQAVNSNFTFFILQHEPGAQCTTLMDCPFQQAYDDALRYFQKTYLYGTAAGTVTNPGIKSFLSPASLSAFGPVTYLKPMAKVPTVTLYNHATGAANSVQDANSTNHASASAAAVGDAGFAYISYTTAAASTTAVYAHYTLDTGW